MHVVSIRILWFWWPKAMQLYCLYRCVIDILVGGETAYTKRYEVEFTGPILPMGARVLYKPLDPRDIAKIEKYHSKVLDGLFIGHEQRYGGKCTKSLMFVNCEEIEEASTPAKVNVKKIPIGNVYIPEDKNGNRLPFIFPLAEGLLKQPGMDKAEKVRRRRYAKIEKEADQADDEEETEAETMTESEGEPLPQETMQYPEGKEPEQWEDDSYDKSDLSTTEGSDIPSSTTTSDQETESENDIEKTDTDEDEIKIQQRRK